MILEFANGKLTWLDLLSMADTQIGDTAVNAVPGRTGADPTYNPTGTVRPSNSAAGTGTTS